MNRKVVAIIAGAAVAVVAVVIALIVVFTKGDRYRLLKLFEFEGTGVVTRDSKGDITPYTNMVLQSGDLIALDTGTMTIQADDDKFIYLNEHTTIKLIASGNSENSKTSIELIEGSITSDIRNKLSADSTYEINTPNSAMSVRGTVFMVIVYEIDGVRYTKVCCFDGEVATKLIYMDGTEADEEVSVPKGMEIIIYEDGKTTDYLDSTPKKIEFSNLSREELEVLRDIIDETGIDLSITDPELARLLDGPYYISFMYNGMEFGTQTVEKDSLVQVPFLNPSATGNWAFDFNTPIDRDTTIEWEE